jgi:hypothetical protein
LKSDAKCFVSVEKIKITVDDQFLKYDTPYNPEKIYQTKSLKGVLYASVLQDAAGYRQTQQSIYLGVVLKMRIGIRVEDSW